MHYFRFTKFAANRRGVPIMKRFIEVGCGACSSRRILRDSPPAMPVIVLRLLGAYRRFGVSHLVKVDFLQTSLGELSTCISSPPCSLHLRRLSNSEVAFDGWSMFFVRNSRPLSSPVNGARRISAPTDEIARILALYK